MKRKLNRNHVLGMDAVSSTSFILKHMKTQLCISSLLKNVQWVCVNAANLALQCVLERDKLLVSSSFFFFFYVYISQMTAPSRGKALSVDFFSLCCYLSPQTQHIQTQGHWSITWLHLLQTRDRDPFKLISHLSSIMFTASISRFPRTSKQINKISHMYFPWCATNMSVEGVKRPN